jgi:uncharacterized membrane protein YfcA
LKAGARGSKRRGDETSDTPQLRFHSRLLATGIIVLLTAGGSLYLMARSRGIECDNLAPLTVLATLAAFLISVCFRQMSRLPDRRSRWFLAVCLLLAGATLFADFRYVRRNRGFCGELRRQMQAPPTSP